MFLILYSRELPIVNKFNLILLDLKYLILLKGIIGSLTSHKILTGFVQFVIRDLPSSLLTGAIKPRLFTKSGLFDAIFCAIAPP